MNGKNYIEFGGPSHHAEYTIEVAGYDHNKFIPQGLCNQIAAELGEDWILSNRGTRIEIFARKFFLGYRDDPFVVAVVQKYIGEAELLGDVADKIKFALPMLLVLDEIEYRRSGEVRLIKCVILEDRYDQWLVRPVESPYYDPETDKGEGQSLLQGWWTVKKNNTAEPIADTFDISHLNTWVAQELNHYFRELWLKMRND